MADHMKVVVYVRADHVRTVQGAGHSDVHAWVREQVKAAVQALRKEEVDGEPS